MPNSKYIEYHTLDRMRAVNACVTAFSFGLCGENFCRSRAFYFFFEHEEDAKEAKEQWSTNPHYFSSEWKFTKAKHIVNSICHRFITIKRRSDGNRELDSERMMIRLINRICAKKESNHFAGCLSCLSLPGVLFRKIICAQ